MSTNDAGVRDDDDDDDDDDDSVVFPNNKIIIPTLSDPLAAAILREDVVELERLLLLLRNRTGGGGGGEDEDEDEDEEDHDDEDGPAHVNDRVPPTNVNTPLLLLAVGPSPVVHTHMVQLLLDYGNAEDVDMGDSFHGITPLMAACNMENETLVELLLQKQKQKQHQRGVGVGGGGANPNAQSADGKTALIQMAKRGHLDLVKLLLRYGANPSIYDEQAKNALMYACSENRIDVVRYLVCFAKEQQQQQQRKESSSSSSSALAAAAKAGVNDYKVDPPLWYACAAGHSEIVQFLLGAGAKIEYRLDNGTIYSTTPLMEACEWGHYEVVKLLLEQGGAEVGNLTGRKALALARRSGYHKVAQLMEFWTKRLRALQSFVSLEASVVLHNNNNEDSVPASLVPLILGQTGRRPDLTHAILSLRMDVLVNRRCWN